MENPSNNDDVNDLEKTLSDDVQTNTEEQDTDRDLSAVPSHQLDAVIKKLASTNHPGLSEDGDLGRIRTRRLSVSATRALYLEAMQTFKDHLDTLVEPDPSKGGLPVQKKGLQQLYNNIKMEFDVVQEKALSFKDALAKQGASAESVQVENEVLALQSQLLAFRQQQSTDLHSEAPSLSGIRSSARSEQLEGSFRSHASSTSSVQRQKLA